LQGDVCYAEGWALGRLVSAPPGEIDAAYADGRLRPTDILLVEGVPAEIPYVAGIITLEPATPNSHVAILARSYRIPFVYVADAPAALRLRNLVGQEVILSAEQYFQADVKITPVAADLDAVLRAEILALKQPGPVALTPKAAFGALSANADTLSPADVRFFGGKAANYGVLRRTAPANVNVAVAFSFDLWDAFLDQVLPSSGQTLRQEIRARAAGYTYPPSISAVRSTLAGIRNLIRSEARFNAAQQADILQVLAGFPAGRKLRFRSSTNVEDSEQFTGAGLYDSYSGCLADDLDADTRGPSQCDPAEPAERGVFRAIQRVYASFYNDNAWLERLRFGLNEDELGMGILAHESFPDAEELANGVATLHHERSGQSGYFRADMVSQAGAVSVTNPQGGAKAELVRGADYGFGAYFETVEWSNLVPLGGHVLQWEADYRALLGLLKQAAIAYGQLVPAKPVLLLDLEYKKMQPGKLILKQMREVPPSGAAKPLVPFLLNEPIEAVVLQGEPGDVFGIHRLKCTLALETLNLRLTNPQIAASFYTNATFEWVEGTNLLRLTGGLGAWPDARHTLTNDTAYDHWSVGAGAALRRFTLETTVTRQVPADRNPLLTQRAFPKLLRVHYATPVPTIDYTGPTTTKEEYAMLTARPAVTARSLLQTRVLTNRAGLRIQTSFYWPEPPRGPTAGYTAPCIQWVGTTISGLTIQPLVLRSDYSQSYHPGHHNFWEDFIFEPQLDPSLSAEQLADLKAKNIRLLVVGKGELESTVWALGLDNVFRLLR
jgi:hypothetical protein